MNLTKSVYNYSMNTLHFATGNGRQLNIMLKSEIWPSSELSFGPDSDTAWPCDNKQTL